MNWMHCNSCHHEYYECSNDGKCDWCGSDGYMLQKWTPTLKKHGSCKVCGEHALLILDELCVNCYWEYRL